MDDLCYKIDIVLNECSKYLCDIEKEKLNNKIFKNFVNGPLLQFVKSIQAFLNTFKDKNINLICIFLSQVRKCLILYETNGVEQSTDLNYEKILIFYLIKRIQKCFFKLEDYLEMSNLIDLDEYPGIFIDRMNIILNGLHNRDNFELIEPNIDKVLFQAIIIAKISDKNNNMELTSSCKQVLNAIQQFKSTNVSTTDSFFQFDYLSSSLSILERRINMTILHLIFEIFNDPFCIIKKLIRKCGNNVDTKLRNSSDLSTMILDLDKSTDVLIQIGLFSVACCKNDEYVIPLKSCISSLELLDSDMIPAIIEFYLDPTSKVKKSFLKLLINHWVCEITDMQNVLNKIIDPFAFIQTSLETSMNIIDTISNSEPIINFGSFVKLLNCLVNFTKYVEDIFDTEISKKNDLSLIYKQFKIALIEYKSCLIFYQKPNYVFNDEAIKIKLLKRCDIVMKYLKDIQVLICNIMENKSTIEFDNTCYILSKTKLCSLNLQHNDNFDDHDGLNLKFSTVHSQKSFYNKSERKTPKMPYQIDNISVNVNETTYGNTIIMDLTNNFIETNTKYDGSIDIWDEMCFDSSIRIQGV